jgi:hypothetical protein
MNLFKLCHGQQQGLFSIKTFYITQATSLCEGKPTIQRLASRYKTHHTYSSDYSFPTVLGFVTRHQLLDLLEI